MTFTTAIPSSAVVSLSEHKRWRLDQVVVQCAVSVFWWPSSSSRVVSKLAIGGLFRGALPVSKRTTLIADIVDVAEVRR